MTLDPPSYREERLPRCSICFEQSMGRDGCYNPDCPSHALCEWCEKRKALVVLDEGRLCGACGVVALRARRSPEVPARGEEERP